jgi:hypothetical protein
LTPDPTQTPITTTTTIEPTTTTTSTENVSSVALSCSIHVSDGCQDYDHPDGWIDQFSCTVANSYLTCAIAACFQPSWNDATTIWQSWQPWQLYVTDADGNQFRIQPSRGSLLAGMVVWEQHFNNLQWYSLEFYSTKPSTTEIVFGIPISNIHSADTLSVWLVSYNEEGIENDRLPAEGVVTFTGANNVCT